MTTSAETASTQRDKDATKLVKMAPNHHLYLKLSLHKTIEYFRNIYTKTDF